MSFWGGYRGSKHSLIGLLLFSWEPSVAHVVTGQGCLEHANIEPEREPFREDRSLQRTPFQVPCLSADYNES